MDELAKALRNIITRDVVFVTGGSLIVAAFLYCFKGLQPHPDDHLSVYLVLGAVSYVIGYAVQDGVSLTHLVTTVAPKRLSRPVKWLYKRFTQTDWKDVPDNVDFADARGKIIAERDIADFERIIILKQVGTTVGPCLLIATVFLWCAPTTEGRWLAALSALVGVVLIGLGWVKVAQESKALERFNKVGGPSA